MEDALKSTFKQIMVDALVQALKVTLEPKVAQILSKDETERIFREVLRDDILPPMRDAILNAACPNSTIPAPSTTIKGTEKAKTMVNTDSSLSLSSTTPPPPPPIPSLDIAALVKNISDKMIDKFLVDIKEQIQSELKDAIRSKINPSVLDIQINPKETILNLLKEQQPPVTATGGGKRRKTIKRRSRKFRTIKNI